MEIARDYDDDDDDIVIKKRLWNSLFEFFHHKLGYISQPPGVSKPVWDKGKMIRYSVARKLG